VRHRTDQAYVLATQELGEADLIMTLLCEHTGLVRGVAPSARKSRKRFGGTLEPMTRVRATWNGKEGRELHRIKGWSWLELLGAVEVLPHGIGRGRVHVRDAEVQLVRPPVTVRRALGAARREGAFLLAWTDLPIEQVRMASPRRQRVARRRMVPFPARVLGSLGSVSSSPLIRPVVWRKRCSA
jgi:hypothetical protein